jgi:hypothetical protein
MTTIREKRPILAIDPTHDGVSFVFIENGVPVDWGLHRDDGNEMEILDRLIADYAPQVVLLEDPNAPGCERRARMRLLLHRFATRAGSLGLTVVKVSRREVRNVWRARGVTRKQASAVHIARLFPDLEPLLPRPRKHSREVPRERLFGILALVLHACETRNASPDDATCPDPRASS